MVLLARSQQAIDQIAREIGNQALAIACDVADWASVDATVARATDRFGAIDILVNNAGVIDPIARIEHATPEGWSRAVDIDLKGVFYCTWAVLPHMKRAGGGTIINISSGAATSALEGWSHYSSTKAAVLMVTRCVHKEEAENGVRCVGLLPGTVATQFQRQIWAAGINPVSRLDWSALFRLSGLQRRLRSPPPKRHASTTATTSPSRPTKGASPWDCRGCEALGKL